MAITVSVVPDAHTQRNGRRYVTEIYEDGIGEVTRRTYLAPVGADYNQIANDRIPQVQASFEVSEKDEHLAQDLQPTNLRFQTVPDLLLKVRADYLNSTGEETCRIAKWIVDRLDDATINTSQCQTAWGVSPAEWNTINGTMDTFAAAIVSVDAAVGE